MAAQNKTTIELAQKNILEIAAQMANMCQTIAVSTGTPAAVVVKQELSAPRNARNNKRTTKCKHCGSEWHSKKDFWELEKNTHGQTRWWKGKKK